MITEEQINFISQIVSGMNDLELRLEDAYKKKDKGRINLISSEILELQKKLFVNGGDKNGRT